MDLNAIAQIAKQEVLIQVRNRWIVLFAVAFGVLALAISYFGLMTAGTVGFQGFTRTSASLLNLVLYLIPLISLITGTISFSGDRNANEFLFAQPVTRTEILAGKLFGLFVSLAIATLLGFGVAGLIIAAYAGNQGVSRYPALVGLSLALTMVFLTVSALISAACERRTRAFGVSLFAWFFFVLFYDLLLMGGTFLFGERTGNSLLLFSLFGNPVDIVRVAGLIMLDGKEIFGAAGAALTRALGGDARTIGVLLASLLAWLIIPFGIARKLLLHQDI